MMNPIFSYYITSSSDITSVYFMEHIPGVKNMFTRKLNLPPKIQGYICLMTRYFFQLQYFECKQADIE